MNHKRHKSTKKADSDLLGGWASGTLQAKKRVSPVPDDVKPIPSKKPKNYCIKRKGPHIFSVGRAKISLSYPDHHRLIMVERRCICGKKDLWFFHPDD
jgi:hypothetical protein